MDRADILNWLQKVNELFGLPVGMLQLIAYMENGRNWDFKTDAVSYRGAKGIMQLTPMAITEIRRIAGYVIDPFNAVHSMYGAAAYLVWLYRQFRNWRLAVAAYNYGYGNVRKNLIANGNVLNETQLPRETQQYLDIANWLGYTA